MCGDFKENRKALGILDKYVGELSLSLSPSFSRDTHTHTHRIRDVIDKGMEKRVIQGMLLLLLFEGWMPPSLSLSLPPQHNNINTTTPTQTT